MNESKNISLSQSINPTTPKTINKPPLIIKESKNVLSDKKAPMVNKTTNKYNNQFEDLKKGPVVKKQNVSRQLQDYGQSVNFNESLEKTLGESHEVSDRILI
jgi:hypothetical protein